MRDRKNVPCADCGGKYPYYVMDFHHRDRDSKLCNPGSLPARRWSLNRVKEEPDKCDVVCANCHRERTYGDEECKH